MKHWIIIHIVTLALLILEMYCFLMKLYVKASMVDSLEKKEETMVDCHN